MKVAILPVFIVILFSTETGFSQNKVKTKFEEIQEVCKDLPMNKRTRLSVSSFTVTTPNTNGEFGDNLGSILQNALQSVNCYRVLESLKNKKDMSDEIEFGNSEESDGSGPKKGKMSTAQVIVRGEITEYNLQTKNSGIGPLKSNKTTMKLGFIVKIVNPETRDVLFTKSVNVEGKVSGGTSFGLGLGMLGNLNLGSGASNNPAVANAVEQGVIETVEYLASLREELAKNFPPTEEVMDVAANNTNIIIANASFGTLTAFATLISTNTKIKKVEKTLKDGVAIFKINHTGTTEELLDDISKKLGAGYEVTGLESKKILLKAKG